VILQTATRVILRLRTQGVYGVSATPPTRGVNIRDISGEMVNQAAGGGVDGKGPVFRPTGSGF